MNHEADEKPIRVIDWLWMILLGAIWGASFLFMRLAVPEFGPIALIQLRVTVGGLFLLAIAVAQGKHRELFRSPKDIAMVGFSNSALPYTLFAFSTKFLFAGFASIINATAPFFGALISVVVLRESIPTRKWIGMLVGFCGVCVLLLGHGEFGGSGYWFYLGVGASLLATCMYAIAAHWTKKRLQAIPSFSIATGSQLSAALMLAPFTLFYLPESMPSLRSWLAALALGWICTGLALLIYFHLIQRIGATRTMTVAYLIPLFGVLWGVTLLGETITLGLLGGGGLIVAGLAILSSRSRANSNSKQTAKS